MTTPTTEHRGDGMRRIGGFLLLVVILGGAFVGARELADWVGGLGGVSDVTSPPTCSRACRCPLRSRPGRQPVRSG